MLTPCDKLIIIEHLVSSHSVILMTSG